MEKGSDNEEMSMDDESDEGYDGEKRVSKGDADLYVPGTVKHLRKDEQYLKHMEVINEILSNPEAKHTIQQSLNLEDDPEYALVLKTNNLLQTIGEEIVSIKSAVAAIYKKKFSELEEIVPNPLDYLQLVLRIGNEMDMNAVKMDDIIAASVVMVVTVSGSTTNGVPLPESELREVVDLCEEALQLNQDRTNLLRFIESCMTKLAPNVSAMVGTHIAARIIGLAGGLKALSSMPSCNIMLIGQNHQVNDLFRPAELRNTGILYQADLIQDAPADLRRKTCRVLGNKLTLAARMDSQGVRSNEFGVGFRKEIQEKVAKWEEPSAGLRQKPLPVPGDAPKKKRGGRRVRKMKEARAMTEIQKRMNRRGFGVASENYADEAVGIEYGMLNENNGDLRRAVAKKMKLSQKTLKKLGQVSSKGAVSGLASSFNLADAQGIELISSAKQKQLQVNDKYFGVSSGFSSIHPHCFVLGNKP